MRSLWIHHLRKDHVKARFRLTFAASGLNIPLCIFIPTPRNNGFFPDKCPRSSSSSPFITPAGGELRTSSPRRRTRSLSSVHRGAEAASQDQDDAPLHGHPLPVLPEEHHPEFLETIRGSCGKGGVEILSGGFYDRSWRCCLMRTRSDRYGRSRTTSGRRSPYDARGMWPPSGLGAPSPACHRQGGIDHVVVDDFHFSGGPSR